MTNRIAIATLIVTFLGVLITFADRYYPTETQGIVSNSNQTTKSLPQKKTKPTELIVAGMNLKVFIKEGSRDYQGGEVRGMNQKSTIYVSKGQVVNVKANGSNIKLMVDRELIDGIRVTKSGLNIDVIEL